MASTTDIQDGDHGDYEYGDTLGCPVGRRNEFSKILAKRDGNCGHRAPADDKEEDPPEQECRE